MVCYDALSVTVCWRLQAVQNAAARVVTGTRKFDHITPLLRDLHWLRVRQGSSTSWPWQFSNAYTDWRQRTWLAILAILAWQSLLSSASDTCGPLAPGYQGQRPRWGRGLSFAVAGPVILNRLPAALRTATPPDVRWTSEGPPVWLTDSASDDYLWRAL